MNRKAYITPDHPFFSKWDAAAAARRTKLLGDIKNVVESMSIANEVILWALIDAYDLRVEVEAEQHCLTGCGWVNRKDIAERLGHEVLRPHDITLLRKLTAFRLVNEQKRTLPVSYMIGAGGTKLRRGAGFEFVYTIHPDILFGLSTLKSESKVWLREIYRDVKEKSPLEDMVLESQKLLNELRGSKPEQSMPSKPSKPNRVSWFKKPFRG